MEFVCSQGRHRYDELVRAAAEVAVGLDFDGTLSPIVDDPAEAWIHPHAGAALVQLAPRVRALAVITGRPVAQARRLGHLDGVGAELARAGQALHVFGHYGAEHWASDGSEAISPAPPPGLADFCAELPRLLAELDLADVFVEDKELSVAVHTRRLAEPDAALARLHRPLEQLAHDHGLALEPGRRVLEARGTDCDKGDAVRALVAATGARGFCFVGDDLGDLKAFAAVEELRSQGLPALLVCSASEEQPALREAADVAVDGPDGVVEFLHRLRADAAAGQET